jgi:Sec-independent protein translocase protein TatA
VILLAIVSILFGGSWLPKPARNLGRAQKELREGMQEHTGNDDASETGHASGAKET